MQIASLPHFFDISVTMHAVVLNPALSARGERYRIDEGKTPEISITECRKLLASIGKEELIHLRDRAIIYVLIYTAARVGATAELKLSNIYSAASQWMLHIPPDQFLELRSRNQNQKPN